MWHELGVAVALLLVIEGIIPFLNPAGLKRVLLQLAEMPETTLRFCGLSSMVIGCLLLYLIR